MGIRGVSLVLVGVGFNALVHGDMLFVVMGRERAVSAVVWVSPSLSVSGDSHGSVSVHSGLAGGVVGV